MEVYTSTLTATAVRTCDHGNSFPHSLDAVAVGPCAAIPRRLPSFARLGKIAAVAADASSGLQGALKAILDGWSVWALVQYGYGDQGQEECAGFGDGGCRACLAPVQECGVEEGLADMPIAD